MLLAVVSGVARRRGLSPQHLLERAIEPFGQQR
jgi:hypothetical protein